VQIILNRQRIVEEEDLIAIGAEKEEALQLCSDVIYAKFRRDACPLSGRNHRGTETSALLSLAAHSH